MSDDSELTQEERRRFFRIDDEMAVFFIQIEEDVKEHELEAMGVNQEYHLTLEMKIRQAMVEVRSASPKIAQVLDLMNQKINLLRASEELLHSEPVLKKVNISACGVAFSWHEDIPVKQKIMLSLYLQPNHELIRTPAHVVGVVANEDEETAAEEPYLLRIDFEDINHSLQEVLIQHVVQRQAYQLRKRLDDD